jgi:RNA polymerase sigma factor (sigma-70 family)
MSPLTLRRYRADRLLRDEFERMRGRVIGGVSQRLRAVGVQLEAGDLDACYAEAWQGLYASVLDGSQIDSPEAWLARVAYRRAIDEHRARKRLKRVVPGRDRGGCAGSQTRAGRMALAGVAPGGQRDLAERLDDRERLRQLFEALRCRLSTRERQAATLCYLQGLTRAEAAARMGVSERRMHKLMDGGGASAPGVAQKVGALVETIAAGRWCDEQGSLMRGFAYGVLDPAGERYRLADAHRAACPACRAYVLSLRGLAAVLPPVPSLLHLLLAPGAAAGGGAVAAGATGSGGAGAAGGAGALGSAGAGGSGATALAGSTASSGSMLGALTASGGAGGGWWLAGGVGAKLAAGCVLALGVGAGCVALGGGTSMRDHARAPHARTWRAMDRTNRAASAAQTLAATASALAPNTAATPPPAPRGASRASPARRAAREFGPEQSIGGGGQPASSSVANSSVARAASVPTTSAAPRALKASSEAGEGQSAGVPAAQREFAPG